MSLLEEKEEEKSQKESSKIETEDTKELNPQQEMINKNKISFRVEATKGDFMPAILMLEKNLFDINEPIIQETGDTLLHLSTSFSLFNVTRTLIEKFNADLNVKNKNGHSPLHIICSNNKKDIILLNYFLKFQNLNVNSEDNSGLYPIHYTVINQWNSGFMMMVAKGSDLGHIDKLGNNLIYFSIANDNIFVTNFLFRHCCVSQYNISLNSTFYNDTVSLSDVLITNKNVETCEHLIVYFNKFIQNSSLESSCKLLTSFSFYNRYNYEIINTLLYYRASDFKGFIYSMFPFILCYGRHSNKYTRLVTAPTVDTSFNETTNISNRSHINLEYSKDNTLNSVDISNAPSNTNMRYSYIIKNFYLLIYEFFLLGHRKLFLGMTLGYFLIIILLNFLYSYANIFFTILNIVCIFTTFFALLFKIYDKNCVNNISYNLNDKNNNILGDLIDAIDKQDIFLYPNIDEICEFCLTKKKASTIHCLKCDKCIKKYFFHSNLFNTCIHKENVKIYFIFLFSLMLFHLIGSFGCFSNSLFFIGICLLFISIILLGKIISIFICLINGITLHTAYNYHKSNNYFDNIVRRNGVFEAVPKINLLQYKEIFPNLCS